MVGCCSSRIAGGSLLRGLERYEALWDLLPGIVFEQFGKQGPFKARPEANTPSGTRIELGKSGCCFDGTHQGRGSSHFTAVMQGYDGNKIEAIYVDRQ